VINNSQAEQQTCGKWVMFWYRAGSREECDVNKPQINSCIVFIFSAFEGQADRNQQIYNVFFLLVPLAEIVQHVEGIPTNDKQDG